MATLFSDILSGVTVLIAMVSRRRIVVVVVRAVVVAAVVGIFAVSRASATCGDWLAHPTKTTGDESMTEEVSRDVATPVGDVAPAPTDAPSRPCRGPFCGKAPSTPAAPTPAPIPTFTEHTLAVLALSGADDQFDANFSCLTADDADPLSGFGRRIDHPPRA